MLSNGGNRERLKIFRNVDSVVGEEIYATGNQKSKSGVCYRRDANLFEIISRKTPSLKPKLNKPMKWQVVL